MGNQMTTLGQIYPVEYYLADYCNEMIVETSLGSTRFMKVAKVRHCDFGYCVAKVYAINDTSISIQEQKQKIEQIRDTLLLEEELNSLPYISCLISEKCVLVLRQYIKYNLYDRLSTRPFLTSIEKRWIAYQLLRCVQSIHKQSIYHGDIKSENVLVTSFLWVALADFASYKPVVLPANNPSDFSYFFDTSRRHCCNMAPERFVEPLNLNSGSESDSDVSCATHLPITSPTLTGQPAISQPPANLNEQQLTAQMDLFSLGCVLAELFSEDTPNSSIFDLGQILMYKNGKYDPTQFIESSISEPLIRRLILNLIDLDPSKRNSAGYHLDNLVPSLFPAYFHTLYEYWSKLIPLSPGMKILTLDRDLVKLNNEIVTENEQGLLIPLMLATSTLRSLQGTDAKLVGLRLCVRLIESSEFMSDYILDRLLPYIIQMLSESSESRVRALCVSSLNTILKRVHHLQASDANIFIDYILPSLLPLAHDSSTLVRITLASNISDLSDTSRRFLDPADDERLNSLQEAFGGIVSQLLVDPNNHVRRAVLNERFDSILLRIRRNKRKASLKQIEPRVNIKRQDVVVHSRTSPPLSSASFNRLTRPRGILLAHLQEHKAAINKLLVVPGTSTFISCSSDATIKLWDSAGVSTRPQVLLRSKRTFVSPDAGAFVTMSGCKGSDTLLALTDTNNLHSINIHSASPQSRIIKTRDESITDLISLSPHTFATCSTSSNIRGYDLRLPTTMDVWNLKMDGSAGLITCLDGNEFSIACGTSSSVISIFDLRFYIKATCMSYPLFQDKMKKRIRRITMCNDEIYCSVDGNNEVSIWNCESGSRTKTLWASPAPCLSSRQTSLHSVLSMIIDSSKETNCIITAGDDMKIRFWDLNNPHRSYIMSKPSYNSYHKLAGLKAGEQQPDAAAAAASSRAPTDNIYYQTKLVDDIEVIQEADKLPTFDEAQKQIQPAGKFTSSSGAASPHHDSISCLATINESSLLLSASRDGVIKIWR